MTNLYDISSEQPLREIIITTDIYIHDKDISPANRAILEQLVVMANDINENFRYLYTNVSQGSKVALAWQHSKIAAGDLSASDDPDGVSIARSVLTTNGLAQSPEQFNWMLAGGPSPHYTVSLAPGSGVPGHPVIIDRDYVNMNMAKLDPVGSGTEIVAQNVCRPYGLGGLKLQFGEYRVDSGVLEFWPSSIAVGSWIYLEQKLPQVVIQ